MKLIIPIEYYRHGGVERVIVSLIKEISQQIEQTIVILPPNKVAYFQELLPKSEAIIYEPLHWPSNSYGNKLNSFYNKLLILFRKLKLRPLEAAITKKIKRLRSTARIEHLVKQYQATHCLYCLTNRLTPPNLEIPLGMISHDVFWHFAPLTYPDAYVEEYDRSLITWLEKVDIVFSVSEKTRKDILSFLPDFAQKIKTVPNSGFIVGQKEQKSLPHKTEFQEIVSFYFPSSFGIYKDQLTLLQAGIKLAKKGLDFKIIFTGKETDNLVKGNLSLSQQSQTQEYIDYLQKCQQIYQENPQLMEDYFVGLGYCDEEVVEECYQNCSCVVVPSKYEGFGLAVSEAIVRGMPVICSDLAVFHEQVELYKCSDLIEFFPLGDVDALATSLEKFILSPKPKLSTTKIAERFNHWTWKEVAQEYVRLFQLSSQS